MAFWEDLNETLSIKSKELADKAKTLTDIANLKGQIVSYENAILRNYREIGRAYYNSHKNDLAKEFPDEMDAITEAKHKIAELNSKISDLKGTKKCSECGSEIPNDSVFCSKCGQKVENESEVFYDEEDTDSSVDLIITDTLTDIIDEDDTELL